MSDDERDVDIESEVSVSLNRKNTEHDKLCSNFITFYILFKYFSMKCEVLLINSCLQRNSNFDVVIIYSFRMMTWEMMI